MRSPLFWDGSWRRLHHARVLTGLPFLDVTSRRGGDFTRSDSTSFLTLSIIAVLLARRKSGDEVWYEIAESELVRLPIQFSRMSSQEKDFAVDFERL